MGYVVSETIAGDSIISVLMLSSFSLSEYIQGPFSCVGRVGNPLQERVASADTPPITSRCKNQHSTFATAFIHNCDVLATLVLLELGSLNHLLSNNYSSNCSIAWAL